MVENISRLYHAMPELGQTSYHVKLVHGYVTDPLCRHGNTYPVSCCAPRTVSCVEDAAIFSRQGAIVYAREVGGTPVMLTRTGKVRVIHP
jgi:hypothetical protein